MNDQSKPQFDVVKLERDGNAFIEELLRRTPNATEATYTAVVQAWKIGWKKGWEARGE